MKKSIIVVISASVIAGNFITFIQPMSTKTVLATKKRKSVSSKTLLSRAKKLKYGMSLTQVKRIMKVKPTETEEDQDFINLIYGKDTIILGFNEHRKLTSAPVGAPQIAKQGEKVLKTKHKRMEKK